jgi:hypothetical protein
MPVMLRRHIMHGNCIQGNLRVALLLLLITFNAYGQTLVVRGNVSTSAGPVKLASVTFVDDSDTTRKFATLTDTSGNYNLSIITAIKEPDTQPAKFRLEQNYPNPFSSSTAISYELSKPSDVSIKIFDILGREVKVLRVSSEQAGVHGVLWDGTNTSGQKIAPGVYFCRVQTENEKQVKKMIFAGGSTRISVPPPSGFSVAGGMGSRNVPELKKNTMVQLGQGIFKVEITNTQSTRPKILATEFSDVLVRQDTSLNFQVQLGIMAYSLCYQRTDTVLQSDGSSWFYFDLYLNNITGTNPKRITNHQNDAYDYTQVWSPDGNYIAFSEPGAPFHVCLYDTKNDTITFLTPDSIDGSGPSWTPDSKHIVYNGSGGPHVIDRDGSNNRKLPYYPDYFYSDSYTFLYRAGNSIYLSNLDGTINEFVFNLMSVGRNYVYWYDFDPYTHRILILAGPGSGIGNLLLTYNVDSKALDTVAIADSSWMFLHPKFSNDYSKIAVIKSNGFERTEKLCLLQNGTETELVAIDSIQNGGLSFYPLAFSPDDKYIAYSKMTYSGGVTFSFSLSLYVVELLTKEVTFIDVGAPTIWNPRKRY